MAKAEAAAALNVLASPLLHAYRHVIIRKTAALHIPDIYQWPETAHEGGLLGYGPRLNDVMGNWDARSSKYWAEPVQPITRFISPRNLRWPLT